MVSPYTLQQFVYASRTLISTNDTKLNLKLAVTEDIAKLSVQDIPIELQEEFTLLTQRLGMFQPYDTSVIGRTIDLMDDADMRNAITSIYDLQYKIAVLSR